MNGIGRGVTPLQLELNSDESYTIEFVHPGYETQVVRIGKEIGLGWVLVDLVMGAWPLVIDLATGAAYGLEEDSVFARLTPKAPSTAQATAAMADGSTAGGAQAYTGDRARIKSEGSKCAAMPVTTLGFADSVAPVIDDILLSELQRAGFEAVGPDDINTMLGLERTKEALGCDEASCMAELGGALGVDYVTAAKIAALDGDPVITLKLMDVRHAKVLARANRSGAGGESALPRLVAEAVQQLVKSSGL